MVDKYRYASWSIDSYIKATDDQRETWDQAWAEIVTHNQQVQQEIATTYQAMVTAAKSLFGSKSSEVRYLEKHGRSIPMWRDDFLKRCKEELSKYKVEQVRQEVEKEKRKTQDENQRNRLMTVLKLILKYGLPDTSEAFDVYEHILSKNRYLLLGNAMSIARSDFSEISTVPRVVYQFQKLSDGSEIDNAIVENVLETAEYAEDGRVFRDCEWNYNRLFDMVEPELFTDYATICEIVR